jgi:integrase
MPDSTVKRIDRRTGYDGETWTTEQAALEWLHDQQAAGRKGEFLEPSKQKFGAYCREVMEGMRIRPQTRASAEVVEGTTKSGKPRVIDLDAATVAVIKAHRKARGALALRLARDDALVFGDLERTHRNPEHVSRQFARDVARYREALGADALPMIRLHDLRHTHATILLLAGVPVHVVSQRLGHASPVVTLSVYAHVMPGGQQEAADLFARLVREAGA